MLAVSVQVLSGALPVQFKLARRGASVVLQIVGLLLKKVTWRGFCLEEEIGPGYKLDVTNSYGMNIEEPDAKIPVNAAAHLTGREQALLKLSAAAALQDVSHDSIESIYCRSSHPSRPQADGL